MFLAVFTEPIASLSMSALVCRYFTTLYACIVIVINALIGKLPDLFDRVKCRDCCHFDILLS